MEQPLKIVIASHKRADKISTHKKVLNSIICIPESQLSEYREHCPDSEIVAHPDRVNGISAKRQWMLEKFGELFSLDDDLAFCKRIYTESGEKDKLTAAEIYDLIQSTYRAAKQAGVHLWGFNTSGKPFTYSAMAPIQMSGYVNTCAFGIDNAGKLYFDAEQKMNEDYWLSGLNAYYHRKIWRDNRFYFHFGDTWTGSGGLAEFRNMDVCEKTFRHLQNVFGSDVICVRKMGNKTQPFQMNFKVPF